MVIVLRCYTAALSDVTSTEFETDILLPPLKLRLSQYALLLIAFSKLGSMLFNHSLPDMMDRAVP